VRGRLLAFAATAVALLSGGGLASADTPPSVWEVAQDPAAAERWKLHVRVQRILDRAEIGRIDDEDLRSVAALAMLEEADAARSPDVRLRFDLGIVYESLDRHRRAVEVLVPALEMAPDHPGATRALEALAYSYAKLGMANEELEAWHRYVPRLVEGDARASAMMNMGESEMRLGHVDDALATFREVLQLCGELPNSVSVTSTYDLTLWDLAVALDRSGDPRGAVDTAAKAMAITWTMFRQQGMVRRTGWQAIQDTRSVFFVPEWERDWYLALGSAAAARGASDPRDAAELWKQSELHREAYVARATAAGSPDPWLVVAKKRLEDTRLQSAAAGKRAARLPPLPSGGRPWEND
jgi:tetratricopeptide (TPR) repeat protein